MVSLYTSPILLLNCTVLGPLIISEKDLPASEEKNQSADNDTFLDGE